MNSKLFLTLALLLTASALMSGCTSQKTADNTATESAMFSFKVVDDKNNVVLERYALMPKGSSALAAIEQLAVIEKKEYAGLGAMVLSINGIKPDAMHYWGLYVDGKYADKGISSYTIDKELAIEFRMESLESFAME